LSSHRFLGRLLNRMAKRLLDLHHRRRDFHRRCNCLDRRRLLLHKRRLGSLGHLGRLRLYFLLSWRDDLLLRLTWLDLGLRLHYRLRWPGRSLAEATTQCFTLPSELLLFNSSLPVVGPRPRPGQGWRGATLGWLARIFTAP
jgi:hypothetical protein